MDYGLAEFEEENKQSFLYLMKSPFIVIKPEMTNSSRKET